MAVQQFLATVRSDGALTLSSDTQENLHLKPGETVRILLERTETASEISETPESFDLSAFFAETDAVDRQPFIPSDPQDAQVSAAIAEKHRQMGLKIPC